MASPLVDDVMPAPLEPDTPPLIRITEWFPLPLRSWRSLPDDKPCTRWTWTHLAPSKPQIWLANGHFCTATLRPRQDNCVSDGEAKTWKPENPETRAPVFQIGYPPGQCGAERRGTSVVDGPVIQRVGRPEEIRSGTEVELR